MDIPTEFYENAINFHRKLNRYSIFIVICDEAKFDFCSKKLTNKRPSSLNVRILKKSDDYVDFVTMALCNTTIVTNTMGVLHGLFTMGDRVTFYQPSDENTQTQFIPNMVGKELPNWHPICIL